MRRLTKGILYVFLAVCAFLAVYPFMLMVLGSLKTPAELSSNPAGLPRAATMMNYADLYHFNAGMMQRAFLNSIFITASYLALSVVVCSLAAYAFAKFRFWGRDVFFLCLLGTIMVPGEVLLPPLFLMFSKIGWIDTFQVQIIPGIANVFGMFLIRQYMMGIHDSVLESARLDGDGEIGILCHIMLPMSAPVLGAFLILQGLSKWNDFLWPAMLVNSYDKLPIMVILPLLNTDSNSIFSTPWTLMMAGCTVATLPIVLLFLAFQEKIMQSVTLGSVKE